MPNKHSYDTLLPSQQQEQLGKGGTNTRRQDHGRRRQGVDPLILLNNHGQEILIHPPRIPITPIPDSRDRYRRSGHDDHEEKKQPWMIRIERTNTPDRGRIMLTRDVIQRGTVLFRISPQAVVADSENRRGRCGGCLKSLGLSGEAAAEPVECGACHSIWYCPHASEDGVKREAGVHASLSSSGRTLSSCQRKDWEKVHRFECGFLGLLYGAGLDGSTVETMINLSFSVEERAAMAKFEKMEFFERDYLRVLMRVLVLRFREYRDFVGAGCCSSSNNNGGVGAVSDEEQEEDDQDPPPLPFLKVWDLVENRESFTKEALEGPMTDVARILDAFQTHLQAVFDQTLVHGMGSDKSTPWSTNTTTNNNNITKSVMIVPRLSLDGLLSLTCKEECNSFGLYEYPIPDATVTHHDQATTTTTTSTAITAPPATMAKKSYGLGIYIQCCIYSLNHSCSPNMYHVAFRNQILVYAARDIQEGEELNIAYLELGPGYQIPYYEDDNGEGVYGLDEEAFRERRAYLQRIFHFECGCERCTWEEKQIDRQQQQQQPQQGMATTTTTTDTKEDRIREMKLSTFLRTGLVCEGPDCFGFVAPWKVMTTIVEEREWRTRSRWAYWIQEREKDKDMEEEEEQGHDQEQEQKPWGCVSCGRVHQEPPRTQTISTLEEAQQAGSSSGLNETRYR